MILSVSSSDYLFRRDFRGRRGHLVNLLATNVPISRFILTLLLTSVFTLVYIQELSTNHLPAPAPPTPPPHPPPPSASPHSTCPRPSSQATSALPTPTGALARKSINSSNQRTNARLPTACLFNAYRLNRLCSLRRCRCLGRESAEVRGLHLILCWIGCSLGRRNRRGVSL